jgi:hypothetical protein
MSKKDLERYLWPLYNKTIIWVEKTAILLEKRMFPKGAEKSIYRAVSVAVTRLKNGLRN